MKSIYLIIFVIFSLSIADVILWSYPVFFSISFYVKLLVLLAIFYLKDDMKLSFMWGGQEDNAPDYKYISEMFFLLFFSLWFAVLHNFNAGYISKSTGVAFFVAAFSVFSIVISFAECLDFRKLHTRVLLLFCKISMYFFALLGIFLSFLGEWRWDVKSFYDW